MHVQCSPKECNSNHKRGNRTAKSPMDLICLCCLAETSATFKTSTRCEFQADECCDANQSTSSMIQLGEIYSQLLQLPPSSEKRSPDQSQPPLYGEICSRCVDMLKDFYRFRTRAIRAYEELQTKANIAKIINSLEQSSVGSVEAEQTEDDLGRTHRHDKAEQLEATDELDSTALLPCTSCNKKFTDRKLLTMHAKTHSTTNKRKYRCKQCEIEFTTKRSCHNHQLKIHGKVLRCSKDQAPATSDKNTQFDNGRRAKESRETNNRRKKAEPGQPKQRPGGFGCDVCFKSFTRKSSLNHHKQVLHAGVRQHMCHICNRTFGKGDSLNTHLALHVGKKYRCKLCSKSFAKSSFLRKHLEEHEWPESKRKYTCAVCSKRFATISHLHDHELIHSDKKPHKCNHCEKSFRQKQQLKVHTYQHFGKPFQCSYCELAYTSPSRLQAHVGKHHPGREQMSLDKFGLAVGAEASSTSTVSQPDFGDKAVNEEILNEICYQINSNPLMLENIDAGGVNLICNEQIIFLNE